MPAGRAFFDTNILLYMYSTADLRKQAVAKQLFGESVTSGQLVVSTQVVQEFHSAGLRKLMIPRQVVRTLTLSLLDLPMIHIDGSHIRQAVDHEDRYGISFWDALILAAAESADATVLYSEDLNDGQLYGRVRVENPLKA